MFHLRMESWSIWSIHSELYLCQLLIWPPYNWIKGLHRRSNRPDLAPPPALTPFYKCNWYTYKMPTLADFKVLHKYTMVCIHRCRVAPENPFRQCSRAVGVRPVLIVLTMPGNVGTTLCLVAVVYVGAASGRPEMNHLSICECSHKALTCPCGFSNYHYNNLWYYNARRSTEYDTRWETTSCLAAVVLYTQGWV